MAPNSPWRAQTIKTKDDGPKHKHGIAPIVTQQVVAFVDYAEVQTEELEVLQAIYMEDYQEVEVKTAWSKTTDRAFKLTLRALSNESTSVVLSVKLTATYPKSLPLLQAEGLEELHPRTQTRIRAIVNGRPKEMIGEVMIHAIASEIQDALEDAVQARDQGGLPSLEDERAVQAAATHEQARRTEIGEVRRSEAAQAEEDRYMQQMVEEEVERREAKRRSKPSSRPALAADSTSNSDNLVTFEQAIALTSLPVVGPFDTVQLISAISMASATQIYAARPTTIRLGQDDCVFAVRCVQLKASPEEASNTRDLLAALEEELEALTALRQPNIVNLYAFKVERSSPSASPKSLAWQVTVLCDFANRGSLAEMLEDGQTLPVRRARQWSLDLLEALDFYHRHGIVHKSIRCSNILVVHSTSGLTKPLLADAGFSYRVDKLQHRATSPSSSRHWCAPELTQAHAPHTRKSDVWDFGIVLAQMLLGLPTTGRFASPSQLMSSLDLSSPLEDLLRKILNRDPRIRPSAFDLIPSEFFRSDTPALVTLDSHNRRRPSSSTALHGQKSPTFRRSRHNSTNRGDVAAVSRYANDFAELNRLGKGGFGEVVKARNKLDGGVYAIKKIKQDSPAQLEQVLSEIVLLHRLNHAYVVRYYSAWVEDDSSGIALLDEEAVSTTEDATTTSDDDGVPRMDFGVSSRGLDFVSSNGFTNIEFGNDDDDEESEDNTEGDSDQDADHRERPKNVMDRHTELDSLTEQSSELESLDTAASAPHRIQRSTLYIQMEYCERHTLRDLIRKDMHARPDEGWNMLRQILEGLAHIHSHGIIHRDLKPDNIFIDNADNPRIGDFGLATTSQYHMSGKVTMSSHSGTTGDMTRSVGTTLYVAPELRSGSGAAYNDKVDMYSLGIIFFEMCFALRTAMERHHVLQTIRAKEHSLPAEFQTTEKAVQGAVITCLISHVPSERPSSRELLNGGLLPLQIEDETIRQALRGLNDSASPYYQKMMSALFSQTQEQRIKDYAWDIKDNKNGSASADELRVRDMAKQSLRSIFRRHGAEEVQRASLLPRSAFYSDPAVVQLLDATGSLLQLPYDLTLPYARQLARQSTSVQRSYAFGSVFRDSTTGGPPRANVEVDFDIMATATESDDIVLHEAESIKVVDEIIDAIPMLSSTQMCYHINHADLLDTVLEFCRIEKSQRPAVKETMSKLNFHQWTWQKVRAELRSPLLGIPSTSLDDLAQFDFRDSPEKAIRRLETLLEGSQLANNFQRPASHLRQLVELLKQFGIRRKVFVCPLASYNEKFYAGGIIFQCIHDKKHRSVFAAGGRYDHLIEAHRPRGQAASPICHAVGVNIGWDGLIASIVRNRKNASSATYLKRDNNRDAPPAGWHARRCDVLVDSSDPTMLRSIGVKLLATLWSNDISAELATQANRDVLHPWVVVVKHEASSTLKIVNKLADTDAEVPSASLVGHIRQEMRERDLQQGTSASSSRTPASLARHKSFPESGIGGGGERKADVQVLMAQHRSKKQNKYQIVEAAQQRWSDRVEGWKDAPILAIETRDDVLETIRETRLGDAESWRKALHGVQLAERQYVGQVQELLRDMRKKWTEGEGMREACVFNFRTGSCIYYDLGL